jgi:hypothetical protein
MLREGARTAAIACGCTCPAGSALYDYYNPDASAVVTPARFNVQ